jgi:hypothetical protein
LNVFKTRDIPLLKLEIKNEPMSPPLKQMLALPLAHHHGVAPFSSTTKLIVTTVSSLILPPSLSLAFLSLDFDRPYCANG